MQMTTNIASCIRILILLVCLKVLIIPSYRSTDFEVHRNWLAITSSLPLSKWYFENTSEWTLDYPPMFAYFEKLLSIPAKYFDPSMLKVSKLSYSSQNTILFQRLTVSITDIVLLITTYLWSTDCNDGLRAFYMVAFNMGLFIVDHMHFQYNGMLIGLLVACMVAARNKSVFVLSALYTVLVLMKHLFATIAPLIATILLRHCIMDQSGKLHVTLRSIFTMVTIALIILLIVIAAFAPILLDSEDKMAQLMQIFSRLFPFGRGLVHAYWAPNIWALYYGADKFLSFFIRRVMKIHLLDSNGNQLANSASGLVGDFALHVLPRVTPGFCGVLLILCSVIASVAYWRSSDDKGLVRAVGFLSLSSFMFGFHVHEKAVLISLIVYSLLPRLSAQEKVFLQIFSAVGVVSLFPLIPGVLEWYIKVFGTVAYLGFSWQLLDCKGLPIEQRGLLYVVHLMLIASVAYSDIIHPYVFTLSNGMMQFEFLPLMQLSLICAAILLPVWFYSLLCLFAVPQ